MWLLTDISIIKWSRISMTSLVETPWKRWNGVLSHLVCEAALRINRAMEALSQGIAPDRRGTTVTQALWNGISSAALIENVPTIEELHLKWVITCTGNLTWQTHSLLMGELPLVEVYFKAIVLSDKKIVRLISTTRQSSRSNHLKLQISELVIQRKLGALLTHLLSVTESYSIRVSSNVEIPG